MTEEKRKRGRPKLSDEEKARRKAAKQAQRPEEEILKKIEAAEKAMVNDAKVDTEFAPPPAEYTEEGVDAILSRAGEEMRKQNAPPKEVVEDGIHQSLVYFKPATEYAIEPEQKELEFLDREGWRPL